MQPRANACRCFLPDICYPAVAWAAQPGTEQSSGVPEPSSTSCPHCAQGHIWGPSQPSGLPQGPGLPIQTCSSYRSKHSKILSDYHSDSLRRQTQLALLWFLQGHYMNTYINRSNIPVLFLSPVAV